MNITVCSATGVSPFHCLFGFDISIPLDAALSSLQDVTVQSVSDLVSARSQVHLQVAAHLEKASADMAKYANRHRRHVEFTPGMLVWLKTDHLQLAGNLSTKLSTK